MVFWEIGVDLGTEEHTRETLAVSREFTSTSIRIEGGLLGPQVEGVTHPRTPPGMTG